MRAARRLVWSLLLLGLLVPAGGCRSSRTGVHVRVTFDGISTPQLAFAVLAEDAVTPLVSPTQRPAAPGGDLRSPQDVIIYLPDTSQTVVCRAATTSIPVASDERAVAVSAHEIAEVTLTLGFAGKENGQPCSAATQCASGFCVDQVCCGSACGDLCTACNLPGSVGACTAVPAGAASGRGDCVAEPPETCGRDGKCDGAGGCRRHPVGTDCLPAACNGARTAVMSAGRCNGAGQCQAPTTSTPCDPYLCDAAGVPARCFTSCSAGAECAPTHACNAGSCGLKPNGDGCTDAAECNSGHCADRVCCNIDCAGACTACNLPGSPGICTALPAGALDPHGVCRSTPSNSCGDSGLCDGMGACQKHPTGTVCAAVDCTGAAVTSARSCDGNGVCLPPTVTPCQGNYACNPTTKACYATCIADGECAQGFTCRNNGRCR